MLIKDLYWISCNISIIYSLLLNAKTLSIKTLNKSTSSTPYSLSNFSKTIKHILSLYCKIINFSVITSPLIHILILPSKFSSPFLFLISLNYNPISINYFNNLPSHQQKTNLNLHGSKEVTLDSSSPINSNNTLIFTSTLKKMTLKKYKTSNYPLLSYSNSKKSPPKPDYNYLLFNPLKIEPQFIFF